MFNFVPFLLLPSLARTQNQLALEVRTLTGTGPDLPTVDGPLSTAQFANPRVLQLTENERVLYVGDTVQSIRSTS